MRRVRSGFTQAGISASVVPFWVVEFVEVLLAGIGVGEDVVETAEGDMVGCETR